MRSDYKYLIFDADHTLIDFDADVARAFHTALAAVGRDEPDVLRTCIEFDNGNWDRIGLCNVHLPHIQENFHKMYREHVTAIFEHAGKVHGFSAQTKKAEEVFNAAFCEPSHFYDDTEQVLERLAKKYELYVATNGLTVMQRGRLSALEGCIRHVFVSEELGTIKPSVDFFARMLQKLNAKPQECLMVGDSLSTDIAGANAAGIDCVWLNRGGAALTKTHSVAAQITSLTELLTLLNA